MIIGSLNIQGGGNISKRKRISNIINSGKAKIFFIQESKLKSVDSSVVSSCGAVRRWGGRVVMLMGYLVVLLLCGKSIL